MKTDYPYGMAGTGIVPLRGVASDASEMVSQLLLGETVRILTTRDNGWTQVRSDLDGYEGWVNGKELYGLSEAEYLKWKSGVCRRSPYFSFRARSVGGDALIVPPGAWVQFEKGEVRVPWGNYQSPGHLQELRQDDILGTAMSLLGTPYLWGGRTDYGIDCSGLIQLVFLLHGKGLPRDASQQFEAAPRYTCDHREAVRGDIIYFSPGGSRVTHVGFSLGDGTLLHASGKVRVNTLLKNRQEAGEKPYAEKLAGSVAGIQRLQDLWDAGKVL